MKKTMINEGVSLGATIVACILFELSFLGGMILFITFSFFLPRIQKSREKGKEMETEYQQVTMYLEQLLCSYKRYGTVREAVMDSLSIFQKEDIIAKPISECLHVLETGEGAEEGDILEKAFAKVDGAYKSHRMHMIHNFLCEAEQMGGKRDGAIDILLEDLQLWKRRTTMYEKRKGFIRVDTLLAVGFACGMCFLSKCLVPNELGFSLPDTTLYQVSSVMVLCGFLAVVDLVWRKLTGSWLDEKEERSEEEQLRLEQQYNLLLKPKTGALKRHLATRICRREVKKEYPFWLLDVTLHLQTNSVYSAMEESVGEKGGFFANQVKVLLEKIYERPSSLEPYRDFLAPLQLSQVQTGMKILYSVNQNGYEESKRQLDFLVSQNNQLMDGEQKYRFENQTAGLSMLKHLPMVVACVKLLADLVNLLALTMGSLGKIV